MRRRYQFDERKVQRYLAEGRGQGFGADYKPWLTVYDVPSLGRMHRTLGLTTGRVHHLLSDGEWRYFGICDWADEIVDILEQYPLDRLRTYQIASRLGIRPPVTTDGTPYVMTTDLVLIVANGGSRYRLARSIKRKEDLADRRTLEKLEIERRYWKERDVDWRLETGACVDRAVFENIERVRGFRTLFPLAEPYQGCIDELASTFLECFVPSDEIKLHQFCARLAAARNLKPDLALTAAKHLLATKELLTDMRSPVPFELRSLSAFTLPEQGLRRVVAA